MNGTKSILTNVSTGVFKLIDMDNKINYYCAADLNFDRFSFAVNCRNGSKALIDWVLCRNKQKTIPARIPLISTVKQHPTYRGFFTSAVLQTISSTKASGVELKASEYMPAQAGGAAKVAKPSRTRELKGSCVAYGSRNRDVAATYLADLAKKWHIGLGCGIWLQIRDEP